MLAGAEAGSIAWNCLVGAGAEAASIACFFWGGDFLRIAPRDSSPLDHHHLG